MCLRAGGRVHFQVTRLTGDFTVQETDAIQPGPFAPWWSRFGHSLTTLDWDQDGVDDAMVTLPFPMLSPS